MTAKSNSSLAKGHRSRLRERFLTGGNTALADYELLEMILFAAHPRGDVKPLAKQLIKEFGSFAGVIQAPLETLSAIPHVGESAIAAIKTVNAAAERLLREQVEDRPVIQSWTALLDYCKVTMGSSKVEEFRILFLDSKQQLIGDEVQNRGTINHTSVYPREVLKRALEFHATAIILVHNHPSGDTTPSKADIEMTKAIVQAARTLNITVHDHLIIGKKGHYSFKSHGLI